MRTYLTGLARLMDRVEVLRGSFSAAESATLDQLCSQAVQVVEALNRADQLRGDINYCRAFPQHFSGVDTDADTLAATAQWLLTLFEIGLSGEAIRRIAADNTAEELQTLTSQVDHLRELLLSWSDIRAKLASFGTLDLAWLTLPGPPADVALSDFLHGLERRTGTAPTLGRIMPRSTVAGSSASRVLPRQSMTGRSAPTARQLVLT